MTVKSTVRALPAFKAGKSASPTKSQEPRVGYNQQAWQIGTAGVAQIDMQ
jgi:hypothetical protein